MGRIFRYEINPLYLKAVLDKMPVPDAEEAWQYFQKIHQPPKKIWNPKIKIPTIQISRVYLNGILVSLFTLLFLYLVFFRGYSGMSEKKNENIVKKANTGNYTNRTNNGEKKSNIITYRNLKDSTNNTSVNVKKTSDTLSEKSIGGLSISKSNVGLESEEDKNIQKVDLVVRDTNKKDTTNNYESYPILNKKKKRKKAKIKKEEAELLPSMGPENIMVPLGTSNEEEIKLRSE